MNARVSIPAPRATARRAHTALRSALIAWASLWTALIAWATFWSWFVVLDGATDARTLGAGTILLVAAGLLLLWGLVVLVWKRPSFGATGLMAFGVFALCFFHEAAPRIALAGPALAIGAGFALLEWRRAR